MANIDLTQGRPSKVLLLFSLPIILGNFFQQVYQMVDIAIVGRFVGYEAMAGVGATNGLNFLIFGFATGITSGLGVCIAQFLGAKDWSNLRRSVATSLWLSLALSAVLTILPVTLCVPVLHLMHTPPEIFEYSQKYVRIMYFGAVAQVAYNLVACILRALGDSRTPLLFLIFSSVLNIGLDFLFIGAFGWGVEGAAWATVISQATSAALSFIFAFRHNECIRLSRQDWASDGKFVWGHLRIGLPMAFQFSITALGLIMLQAALNSFPAPVIAGFTAANKVQNVGALVSIAFGVAMANYAGQNYGAGDMTRIRQGVRASLAILMAVCVVCGVSMVVFARPLTSIFVGSDSLPEIYDAARKYIVASAVFFPFLYVIFIFRNALQGIGKAFWPLMAGVLELLIRAVSSNILPPHFGYNGIVMIDPLAWIGASMLLFIVYSIQIMRKC